MRAAAARAGEVPAWHEASAQPPSVPWGTPPHTRAFVHRSIRAGARMHGNEGVGCGSSLRVWQGGRRGASRGTGEHSGDAALSPACLKALRPAGNSSYPAIRRKGLCRRHFLSKPRGG